MLSRKSKCGAEAAPCDDRELSVIVVLWLTSFLFLVLVGGGADGCAVVWQRGGDCVAVVRGRGRTAAYIPAGVK